MTRKRDYFSGKLQIGRYKMYKILIVTLILLLMEISLLDTSWAEEDKVSKNPKSTLTKDKKSQTLRLQTTDALSGKQINRSIYTDYKGKRIYFCCYGSRNSFNLDPEKYIRAFQEQGITLEDAPAKK